MFHFSYQKSSVIQRDVRIGAQKSRSSIYPLEDTVLTEGRRIWHDWFSLKLILNRTAAAMNESVQPFDYPSLKKGRALSVFTETCENNLEIPRRLYDTSEGGFFYSTSNHVICLSQRLNPLHCCLHTAIRMGEFSSVRVLSMFNFVVGLGKTRESPSRELRAHWPFALGIFQGH
jgi:hypothetical protein